MTYAKKVLAVALLMVPLVAVAQLGSYTGIVSQVPFEFTVGDKVVPAGEYVVQSATTGDRTLLIRSQRAKIGLFSSASAVETKQTSSADALVFNKYGDRYFLTAIKLEGNRVEYQLPEGKAETQLREQNSRTVEQIMVSALR